MIKGAVFDVDGTLLDSMGIWKSLPAKYLKSKGMTAKENLNDQLYKMSLEEGATAKARNEQIGGHKA